MRFNKNRESILAPIEPEDKQRKFVGNIQLREVLRNRENKN